MTRSPSLSDGFVSQLHPFRFLHERDSSYGALTFTPAGLTPAEQTSLCWTHSIANCWNSASEFRRLPSRNIWCGIQSHLRKP